MFINLNLNIKFIYSFSEVFFPFFGFEEEDLFLLEELF